jgi:hypothetical protein
MGHRLSIAFGTGRRTLGCLLVIFGIFFREIVFCLFLGVEYRPGGTVEIARSGQTSTIAFDVLPRLWRIFDIVPNLIDGCLSLIVG